MDDRGPQGIVPPFDSERLDELTGYVPGAQSQAHNVDHDEGYGQPTPDPVAFSSEQPDPDKIAYLDGVRAGIKARQDAADDNLFSYEEALAAQEQRERGYLFFLQGTADGVPRPVRVRKIPMAHLASIQGLSPRQQNLVMEVLNDAQAGRLNAKTWTELSKTQDKQEELADAMCIGGFMKPRLVGTEAEEQAQRAQGDTTVLWVKRIPIEDRVAFLSTVMNPGGAAARTLEPFPAPRLEGAPASTAMPTGETAV